jgi:hypothetical protein
MYPTNIDEIEVIIDLKKQNSLANLNAYALRRYTETEIDSKIENIIDDNIIITFTSPTVMRHELYILI